MIGARVATALDCASDAGGGSALWRFGDGHACHGVSLDTVMFFASAARPAGAKRAAA